jgi:hypothetical protein
LGTGLREPRETPAAPRSGEKTWPAGHPVIVHTRQELDRALAAYEVAMDNLSSK